MVEISEGLNFNELDSDVARCVVKTVAVLSGNDDLTLHAGQVGDAADLLSVRSGDACGGGKHDRAGGTGGDHR